MSEWSVPVALQLAAVALVPILAAALTIWAGAVQAKRRRQHKELEFWVDALQQILHNAVQIQLVGRTDIDAARKQLNAYYLDLTLLTLHRPRPRETVGFYLVEPALMALTIHGGPGIMANPPKMPEKTPEEEIADLALHVRVFTDTVHLGRRWMLRGYSDSVGLRSMQTRSNQLGVHWEKPDVGKGPDSYSGGWI